MKKLQNLMTALLVLFSVKATAQFADPAINILMTPASVPLNQTGILQVDLGNYGNSNIAANSLRATISVGTNAEIIGVQTPTSDPKWSVLNLTAGTNNTIQLKNTGGSILSFDVGTVNLIIRAKVQGGPSTITGNMVYIAGSNPLLGGAPSASQGNGQTLNDNSTTSLTVSAGGPLPISLAYFNVSMSNCKSNITWESASEQNFKNYIVEYSTDGSDFASVAQINGTGNNSKYNTQHSPASGLAYYRLKAADIDGKYIYSNIVTVKNQCGKAVAIVYPNPVSDLLNINISDASSSKVSATLFNEAGQVVRNVQLSNGSNKLLCNSLAAGIYQLKVVIGENVENFKILIRH